MTAHQLYDSAAAEHKYSLPPRRFLFYLAAMATFSVPYGVGGSVPPPIDVIFSDVDGTLLHYDDSVGGDDVSLKLPASSTGLVGTISRRTIDLVEEIRGVAHGGGGRRTAFVLVSGMRTTTMLDRIPYLPRADAYCSEGGGRIFYPRPSADGGHDGEAVTLVEDAEWRRRLSAAGAAGPGGHDPDGAAYVCTRGGWSVERGEARSPASGALWEFAQTLAERRGIAIDDRGYATMFRVKSKKLSNTRDGEEDFMESILKGLSVPESISYSTNLGCVDFYPSISGKKNCCIYLAQKFGARDGPASCVCLCDDDNDLEMARWCRTAYLPSITSDSMGAAAAADPRQFVPTFDDAAGLTGCRATERALEMLLKQVAGQ